jgi:hypothetical protein
MIQSHFKEKFEEEIKEDYEEIIYPITFYPKSKNPKNCLCSLDYALLNYNPDCEICEKLKEEALSKNITYVLMDEEEEHIIRLLS